MDIIQIVAIGIVSAILAITLKKQSPESGLFIGIMAGIIIFMMILPKLSAVVNVLKEISGKIQIDIKYIDIVLKIIGVAYIAEFGAGVCADAGENVIAGKIELAGKVLIMTISAPVLLSLMDLILSLTG